MSRTNQTKGEYMDALLPNNHLKDGLRIKITHKKNMIFVVPKVI